MERSGDESLAEAFWAVARQLRRNSAQWLSSWNLTPSQARAMRTLDRYGSMRPSALSEHLRIAARSATEVIDDLERIGFVERSADPSDRRATQVSLSAAGRKASADIRSARSEEAERMFGRLSEAEQRNLHRLLRKLTDES
ncbi:MarR family transcriptional regulator [Jatrophihabitans telluris]|uniref:MarR family transcriptional regulator n=1 Tax=Jatrophihabitans telluris TaxID=2038343 RepID=A0ABY4R016_9ACTN|nr:MarR family transcriptional regulator [Jatrophihabitans telluris]UQX89223.1 MarR family transcriptional regulator [Jatrophihabitans telluris]